MPSLEISPLLLALITSILGSILLVLYRRGGARWMFALGGLFFVLGRVMIAAICAFVLTVIIDVIRDRGSDALIIGMIFAAAILAIGGWSIFVVARVVWRDAFGAAQEDAARARYPGHQP